MLESEDSSARITYSFKSGEEATVFTRKLEYKADNIAVGDFTPDDLNRVMKLQSEQAVNQLKAFVEKRLMPLRGHKSENNKINHLRLCYS